MNYVGVIIGPDLRWSADFGRTCFERSSYFDIRGKQNNKRLGREYRDDELLEYVTNIYAVLLTRGIQGTYVYVADSELREHLRRFFSQTQVPLGPGSRSR